MNSYVVFKILLPNFSNIKNTSSKNFKFKSYTSYAVRQLLGVLFLGVIFIYNGFYGSWDF